MAFKDLPTYYYHTHFMEFLDFIKGPCQHLLNADHQGFLSSFQALEFHEQCLVVRLINRKHSLIKVSSLKFAELPLLSDLLSAIIDKGFATKVSGIDTGKKALSKLIGQDMLSFMTKADLHSLYEQNKTANCPAILKSANKALYVEYCNKLHPEQIVNSDCASNFVIRQTDSCIDYFLFLYFGHRHGRLNQFSMRDLGLMRTRDSQAQMQSRFIHYDDAFSAFSLQQSYQEIKQKLSDGEYDCAAKINQTLQALAKPSGDLAIDYDQRIRFKLGKAKLEFDSTSALSEVSAIGNDQAQEFWCRQAYKLGLKEEVESKLNSIIDKPLSDKLLQFSEDFLARKYHKKRTSVLTDMLRDNTRQLFIDETFKGSVEHGVIAYYQARDIQAWRTENSLWQNLFGLCFWPELFEIEGLGLATPFDYLPLSIKQHCFLDVAGEQIEKRLAPIQNNKQLALLITKHCTTYFGQSQGIVHWHKNLLDKLLVLIENSSVESIKAVLLKMCANYQDHHDGFPDIMVLEDGKLRFEEIKSQGDSLRHNQLMQIQHLKQCGFDVGITTVDWTLDPMQPYAVIDIETTGGRAGKHKITEIGMVKLVNGEVVDQWQSLINPQRRIPNMITDLTGIDNQMVANAPLFVDIADEVDKFTENCIFVAHNVNFDYGFIKEEFARINRNFRRPKLCTVQQMRKHYKGIKSYSLANLTKHFDIDMQRHHRALSDAVAASELLKLVNEARMQNQG